MKSIILLLVFSSYNAFACMPAPLYIDIDKVSESVDITTGNPLILRSIHTLSFEENQYFEIKKTKNTTIGGLKMYSVSAKVKPIKSSLVVRLKEKSIKLNLILKERVQTRSKSISRGCGGLSEISYN